eukprot:TRINITY_DN7758_c0_g1_i1.p1 TRINITY_DN7758_c0_g1~~TRINITY_DN7758_c0_g1_i1.p1  ORF type:complete len:511 (-),score=54.46 TRINITY_DN7758_c0_g1_i1:37-1569(-)
METGGFLCYLLCCLIFLCEVTQGVEVIEVYRMIQFEAGGNAFGSQRTRMNLFGTKTISSDIARSILIVPAENVDKEFLESGINCAGGILVLFEHNQQPQNMRAWEDLEHFLLRQKIRIPVYFSMRNDKLKDIYDRLHPTSLQVQQSSYDLSSFDGFKFVVAHAEATPLDEIYVSNFESWLKANDGHGISIEPTIAVVAYYDTFGVAPGVSFGADSNGSGVVALLEIARLFAKLYSRPRMRGKYNIVFLLSAAGRWNYMGTRHWLQNLDSKLLSTIEFALCLDTIGNGEKLYFHISRPPKDPKTKRLYTDFTETAQHAGIPFEIVHKRINISNPNVFWEHEQFSRKRIVAATLSHVKQPRPGILRSNVFDSRTHVDLKILLRNIKFVAEALVKHMYGYHGTELEIFEDGSLLQMNERFVESWLNTLAEIPRVMPYLKNDSKILRGLKEVMQWYVGDVEETSFKVPNSDFIFYGNEKVELSIYKVKPVLFDFFTSLVIGLFLAVLYLSLIHI